MIATTHEECLMIFGTVRNLVEIGTRPTFLHFDDVQVSMLCEFGLKMPIGALFGEVLWV